MSSRRCADLYRARSPAPSAGRRTTASTEPAPAACPSTSTSPAGQSPAASSSPSSLARKQPRPRQAGRPVTRCEPGPGPHCTWPGCRKCSARTCWLRRRAWHTRNKSTRSRRTTLTVCDPPPCLIPARPGMTNLRSASYEAPSNTGARIFGARREVAPRRSLTVSDHR